MKIFDRLETAPRQGAYVLPTAEVLKKLREKSTPIQGGSK